jgi:hypothetical protein
MENIIALFFGYWAIAALMVLVAFIAVVGTWYYAAKCFGELRRATWYLEKMYKSGSGDKSSPSSKVCPRCGITNPPSALICDCGMRFKDAA